jgi:hypothetical protein
LGCRWIILEWRKDQADGNKNVVHSEPGTTERRYNSAWTIKKTSQVHIHALSFKNNIVSILHDGNERLP